MFLSAPHRLVDLTALYAAADSGHERVVQVLLDVSGIDVNKTRSDLGFSPLYMAAQNGNEIVVKLLLQHPQIEVNPKDLSYGATPLLIAASYGFTKIVEMLCEHPGIDVNHRRSDDGNSSLLMASCNGHKDVVRSLLRHKKCDVNLVNAKDGASALFMAAGSENGVCVYSCIFTSSLLPLYFVFVAYANVALGQDGAVEELLKVPGIDVNLGCTDDGTTPFYWAYTLSNGDPHNKSQKRCLELLIQHKDTIQDAAYRRTK